MAATSLRGVLAFQFDDERQTQHNELADRSAVGPVSPEVSVLFSTSTPDAYSRCARVTRYARGSGPRTSTPAGLQRFGKACGPALRRDHETRAERRRNDESRCATAVIGHVAHLAASGISGLVGSGCRLSNSLSWNEKYFCSAAGFMSGEAFATQNLVDFGSNKTL